MVLPRHMLTHLGVACSGRQQHGYTPLARRLAMAPGPGRAVGHDGLLTTCFGKGTAHIRGLSRPPAREYTGRRHAFPDGWRHPGVSPPPLPFCQWHGCLVP